MNSEAYLQSYGWTKGEALKNGGIKKPILVRHKKDTKGLGHGSDEHEVWWERLFDGQLKGLDVKTGSKGVTFDVKEAKASGVSQHLSPLYRMFVKGGTLQGSLMIKPETENENENETETETKKKTKTDKKGKKSKKSKKGLDKDKVSKKKSSRSSSSKSKEEAWIQNLVNNMNKPVTA